MGFEWGVGKASCSEFTEDLGIAKVMGLDAIKMNGKVPVRNLKIRVK